MFLTDIPDSSVPPASDSADPPTSYPDCELIPLCFLVSHNPLFYSLASQKAVKKIRQLERLIGEDPGNDMQRFDNDTKQNKSEVSWYLCQTKS